MRIAKHNEIVEAMEYAIAATTQRSNTGWNHKSLAAAALDAMLEAVVRLGVGNKCEDTQVFVYYPALILRMEASDDK